METGATGRIRAVAGAAVAAGALLATTSQLAQAAVPLAPADHEADTVADAAEMSEPAAEVVEEQEAVDEVALVAETPSVTAEPVAAPVATPFGLTGLPVEIAGPLAQAEQAIKDLQQQLAPPVPMIAPQIAAPAVLPIGGQISSGFGSRWGAFHYGVDIADALGTPIHSAMGGTVLESGPASGFGMWVRVLQDDGTTAVYGHINESFVHEGQRVNAGDVIATVGNRGQSTGPHLHLEIWDANGGKIDPVAWLAAKGVLMQQHWGAD
ncbi:M23 family metallopeptidase [Nocardia sp. NPDC050406]|uniref:M23 family metallopeptidase n=1 Tax=Nocardia sp. NPDC050406 TaxID=3364318 RepID=UPI0037ADC8DF